jgi:hypothetical protein
MFDCVHGLKLGNHVAVRQISMKFDSSPILLSELYSGPAGNMIITFILLKNNFR